MGELESISENVQGLLEFYVHSFNTRLVRRMVCSSFIKDDLLRRRCGALSLESQSFTAWEQEWGVRVINAEKVSGPMGWKS